MLVLAFASELFQLRSNDLKDRTEGLLRKFDFCQSFGQDIPKLTSVTFCSACLGRASRYPSKLVPSRALLHHCRTVRSAQSHRKFVGVGMVYAQAGQYHGRALRCAHCRAFSSIDSCAIVGDSCQRQFDRSRSYGEVGCFLVNARDFSQHDQKCMCIFCDGRPLPED